MAKFSLHAAFEQLWRNIVFELGFKPGRYTRDIEPIEAVDGDFWIDTSADNIETKKIYESPNAPLGSQDGDLWVDTSDLI